MGNQFFHFCCEFAAHLPLKLNLTSKIIQAATLNFAVHVDNGSLVPTYNSEAYGFEKIHLSHIFHGSY